MDKKCPNCGGILSLRDGHYHCSSCMSNFSVDDINAKVNFSVSTAEQYRLGRDAGERVYSKCINSVAIIQCEKQVGSGFLATPNLVVTNAHVIENENYPEVILADESFEAQVVYRGTPGTIDDLAVLRIEPTKRLTPLRLGNSDRVNNGQQVFAMGNSLGEGLMISSGIISDKDRVIDGARHIMSDVAINPGNSGGPLLDADSQVIAVCVSGRLQAAGMKYFIPINSVKGLLK